MEEIRAEMAANVYEIVASPGDQLAADDVIVMTESMKMEIPVVAPRTGTLVRLVVAAGDFVDEGELIAEIE